MQLAIGSLWRNSSHNVPDYMRRMKTLKEMWGNELRVIAVEGDSRDNTRDALETAARYHDLPLDLVTCNHGGPVFGSVETEERFVALSKVGNACFEAVRPADDFFIYVESDLKWNPVDLMALLEYVQDGLDVVGPRVMAADAFYDIWGYRGLDGVRFAPFPPPYHASVDDVQPTQVSSIGSCLAMRGKVARECRIRNNYCLVGWCEDARAHGYKIYYAPSCEVRQL